MNALNPAAPSVISRDYPDLRRIRAEFVQIEEELRKCHAVQDPVVIHLRGWYQDFNQALRVHQIHPSEVIQRYQAKLEEFFEHPLDPAHPFPQELYGEDVPSLVQFMIAKLRSRTSLLYSTRVDAAAPPAVPPGWPSGDPATHVQPTQSVQAMKMLEAQQLKRRVLARDLSQKERMEAIQARAKQLVAVHQQEVQQTIQNIDTFKSAVEQLEREVLEHQEKMRDVESEVARAKSETASVRQEMSTFGACEAFGARTLGDDSTSGHAAHPAISGDFQNLRRIHAELVQIKAELRKCRTIQDPVFGYLRRWYQNFSQALTETYQVHPNEVILKYQAELERFFENPLNPENPFPPELFGVEVPPLVQFMVAKLRNRTSLLHSARVEAAAPPDSPEASPEVSPEVSPEALFQHVEAVQAQRTQAQAAKMREVQQLKARFLARDLSQKERMDAIEARAKQFAATHQQEIQQTIQSTRREVNTFKNTVEQLEREVLEHQEDIRKIASEIAQVKNETASVRQEMAALETRIHGVEAAIEQQKNDWQFVAIAIVVTLLASQVLPGTAMTHSNGRTMLGWMTKF